MNDEIHGNGTVFTYIITEIAISLVLLIVIALELAITIATIASISILVEKKDYKTRIINRSERSIELLLDNNSK